MPENARSTPCAVSVVVSTYNRADRIEPALRAILSQTGDVPYEIVVVDNNSTDDTAAIVQRIAREAGGRLRYAFEARQGLSHGRNTGIGLARGSIVAFTDDDVRVAPDWVLEIARAFDRYPDIDYVGGRVLPRWLAPPPAWLTTAHWSPLALQDYGSEPVRSSRQRAVCLVGASLAFRRRVFDMLGLFNPAYGRIRDGIGSTEDHEMQLRMWKAGLQGLYVPSILVTADVTADRLTREYHRRWHRGHGRHCARMRLRERVPADMGPLSEPSDVVTIFGAPAFVYAEVWWAATRWLRALGSGGDALFYDHRLRYLTSYLRDSYNAWSHAENRGTLRELISFSRAYLRKRAGRLATGPARV
ncbi:MAG TPA: glycosyltransferase [Vicinamibacterales bacterium]|nr:glycosyltransferase [Vicinamibacterales bacterium]